MSAFPDGWAKSTIGDLATYVSRGKSPKYVPRSDLPVINQKCVRWHGVEEQHLKFVDPTTWGQWNLERYVQAGDILWNSTGTGTVGRAALFGGLPSFPRAVVDSHVTIVRPGPGVLPQYLAAFIRSPAVQDRIEEMQSGSTNQVELNRSEIIATAVPVPPLTEQRRIVAKLDALTARTVRARADLDRVPALAEHYKAAILSGLSSGDAEGFGSAGNVGSTTRPAGSLFKWASGKFLPKGNQHAGGVPVFGGNGVNGEHDAAITDSPTLVVGRVGAHCGNVHLTEGPAWITDNAIYAREVSDEIDLRFALLIFRAANLNQRAGGTGQPYVNQDVLNGVEFPWLSREDQSKTVERVERAFAEIDRLVAEGAAARRLLDRLDQAILAKAFRGELVSQDPADEPASVLLDRIRAERAAAPVKGRRGRRAA